MATTDLPQQVAVIEQRQGASLIRVGARNCIRRLAGSCVRVAWKGGGGKMASKKSEPDVATGVYLQLSF